VDAVLNLVDRIPPGRVMTYGDIAAVIGRGGPRQVGRVMSVWGSSVPWWRVVPAHGGGTTGHEADAFARYRDEGTALRPGGDRIDMRRARWDPES
jgi:alkylated DNA nucleotide flippase Atl1